MTCRGLCMGAYVRGICSRGHVSGGLMSGRLIFVDAGVKISGIYYRYMILLHQLLPANLPCVNSLEVAHLFRGPRNNINFVILDTLNISDWSSFSKTVLQRRPRVNQPPWTQDSSIHLARFVAIKQPDFSWVYFNLGHYAAASLLDQSAGCGRFAAASDWFVGRSVTKRYRRCHRPVSQTSPCPQSGHMKHFRYSLSYETVQKLLAVVNYFREPGWGGYVIDAVYNISPWLPQN